jgi:hypothetical protein
LEDKSARPGITLRWLSYLGIIFLSAFSLVYLFFRLI